MIDVQRSTGLKYFLIKPIAWSADLDFLMVFATLGDHCNLLLKITRTRTFMNFLNFTNALPTLRWMSGQSYILFYSIKPKKLKKYKIIKVYV